ncbi:hypothetical protein F5880DRAFT_1490098 [Lentinula raphanica]|nr:hypothetical protein F5880DRAFT_1490098 [Lentinula raphanica]
MLSSFTSFLPSALQNINSNSHASPPPVVDDDDDDDEHDAKSSNSAPTKKKEKKEKGANETFIFVRPPPAKSNHPLNLQVQLVPPSSHTPGVTGSSTVTPRQSLDDGESAPVPSSPTSATTGSDTGGEPLARTSTTASSRSEVSTYSSSGYTSTASFSSVGSTTSGRRMIIPLYNLQAHNVMTNTIVDAGTDAKIARFTRKGLEMIDLAVMEVVEVWPTPSGLVASANNGANTTSARGSVDEGHRLQNHPDRLTPGSSVISVSSAGLSAADEHHLHLPENPIAIPTRVVPQKKILFGKFFRKKDSSHSPDRTPTIPSASIIPPSPTTSIKTPGHTPTHSVIPPSPTPSSRHGRNLSSSMSNFGKRGASASPSGPSALSAFVNFTSSGYPPPKNLGFGRGPALYVWVIRKWIKTPEGFNGTGLFGGMKDVLGSMGASGSSGNIQSGRGLHMNIAGLSEIEVRVEWKRGKRSKSKKKAKDRTQDEDTERSVSRSRRQSVITSETSPAGSNSSLPAATSAETRKKRNRLSTASKASTNEDPDMTLTSIRLGRQRTQSQEDDDGNDSDPEDSETPWTCTLKTRYMGASGLPRSSSSSSTPVKLKIATLSPMPHHPKVVAMLKIPYPLPDLEVQTMSLRKRAIGIPVPPPNSPLSGASAGTGPSAGLVLRAEEIKDVICSTGIWVVVREGFGGVGKVSRKGDGWRIRA